MTIGTNSLALKRIGFMKTQADSQTIGTAIRPALPASRPCSHPFSFQNKACMKNKTDSQLTIICGVESELANVPIHLLWRIGSIKTKTNETSTKP